MMDAGFADNDPRFRLSMRKLRLRLLANAILDVRMQTMGMTDEQAMELMTKQAFQTQAEAEGKLQRAKLSSTQLPDVLRGAAGLAGAAARSTRRRRARPSTCWPSTTSSWARAPCPSTRWRRS